MTRSCPFRPHPNMLMVKVLRATAIINRIARETFICNYAKILGSLAGLDGHAINRIATVKSSAVQKSRGNNIGEIGLNRIATIPIMTDHPLRLSRNDCQTRREDAMQITSRSAL